MQIEIFSDVICPWCFIGKKRLDSVLATELGDGVELRWRPYLLYPNLPSEGIDRGELLRQRYGDRADRGKVPERIRVEAEGEGITLRFDLIQRTPNTLMAHQLLEFAHQQGKQHELAERLFQAYFCEGQDVGDLAVLGELAQDCAMDGDAAADYVSSGLALNEVKTQLARAPELGVSGVPGYYLASAFLLPGAQAADTMSQIIGRVKSKLAAG